MTDIDQPVVQRLLRECRDLLEHDLGEWMDELGPALEEDLFGLANTTHEDAKRSEYLRLRTEVQTRWQKLAEAFKEQLAKELQHVKVVETASGGRPGAMQLELVDDKELTERIVMREFAGRVSEFCSEEMYALDRRITQLVGKEEMDSRGNRFGPKVVCEAVRAGCEAMLADLDARTLLLRQLERQLQAELPSLYRAVNEILIEAGILPELKRTYRRSMAPGTLGAVAADADNILNTLQRLAQARIPAMAGGVGLPGGAGAAGGMAGVVGGGGGVAGGLPAGGQVLPPGAVAVSAEFLSSLKALQALPAATSGELTNVVRMARETEAARQAPPLDAITMDIVATLFDLIFDDEKVPAAVKGMVSRLQIPVLKVAMIDQRFFSDRSHPVRRFLDSISGIAIRWGEAVSEGDPFYLKLSQLVERIQNSFDQDVAVFGTAVAEMASFVTEHEAQEAETSRVVVEAMQRKEEEEKSLAERHAAARQAAEAALEPLLVQAMPRPIEQFLRGQWQDVLQKIGVTSGLESAPFQTAGRIAEELVWSVTPMKLPEERQRLAALLPKLLPALHQGLDRIGVAAEDRQPLFDALMTLHSAALRADKRALRKAPALEETPSQQMAAEAASAPVALQVTHMVENGIKIEEVSLVEHQPPEGASVQSNSWLRRVKHLVRGDWVEFIDDGQSRRERLTWLSPRRTVYIFSNHATNCAISITPEALAHRLQNETARLVEREAPMFERALDGAIKALDKAA